MTSRKFMNLSQIGAWLTFLIYAIMIVGGIIFDWINPSMARFLLATELVLGVSSCVCAVRGLAKQEEEHRPH